MLTIAEIALEYQLYWPCSSLCVSPSISVTSTFLRAEPSPTINSVASSRLVSTIVVRVTKDLKLEWELVFRADLRLHHNAGIFWCYTVAFRSTCIVALSALHCCRLEGGQLHCLLPSKPKVNDLWCPSSPQDPAAQLRVLHLRHCQHATSAQSRADCLSQNRLRNGYFDHIGFNIFYTTKRRLWLNQSQHGYELVVFLT